ncbi:MAG: hypothetical protein U9P73_05010 [Candidatus Cloacimonadota bacterium]|nr:hypothetical protein [Candidatus Cloacimonadota bacterium]
MKYKLLFLVLLVAISTQLFSWGGLGHEVITRLAIDGLPDGMCFIKENSEYLCDHSIDADKRKSEDPSERNKHFIDVDRYEEFNVGEMIIDKTELIKIYGEDIVDKMGILPWNTVEVLNNLTTAMKENNKAEILFFAADLAHYVGDAHQPQHNILNYNGKLTNQRGIHGRYEIDLIDANLEELETNISPIEIIYVKEPLQFIFDYCTQSNSFAGLIELADLHALKYSGDEYNEKYFSIFWFRTKFMTFHQFSNAAEDLASMYYTAWINAGKPEIK